MILQGIRDNPERCGAVGINVRRVRVAGLTISGFFAGTAGSIFAVIEGSVFPDLLFWTLSLEIVIMCLLGGWFTFSGPMLGAALVVLLRTFAGIYTEYWTLVLGMVLMFVILFLPEGISGHFQNKFSMRPKNGNENN